jgi:hypothetical protein
MYVTTGPCDPRHDATGTTYTLPRLEPRTPPKRPGCTSEWPPRWPAGTGQISSGTIWIAPDGHSATQSPQPLQ